MTRLFITGTGTGIGKTYVTAALVRAALEAGHTAVALKPVISGFDAHDWSESDAGILLAAQRMPLTGENLDRISPFRFAAPLSPDMAAAREGRAIHLDGVLAHCRAALDGPADTVFIEGAGGVCVPLNANETILDWIAALDVYVVLVAGSYLGTISHTLTALMALRQAKVQPRAIVISASPDSHVPLDETAGAISRFAGGVPVLQLPRQESVYAGADLYQLVSSSTWQRSEKNP
jgi:dethiobiotin synthetase